MNKKNLIITCLSVFLTTILIFLGIFFGLKKPDEAKKEDDDQTLKKEIETLENEFKTLKSNFDEKFNKLQFEDFEEYPQDDQEQINQIKEELQKFKEEIAQKQCDQSELTTKKACLLKINSQITNQNKKFDFIKDLTVIFNDINEIRKHFDNDTQKKLTSCKVLPIKNFPFTKQEFNNGEDLFQYFVNEKQNCSHETKLKDQKDCYVTLTNNFNSVLNVINDTNNDNSNTNNNNNTDNNDNDINNTNNDNTNNNNTSNNNTNNNNNEEEELEEEINNDNEEKEERDNEEEEVEEKETNDNEEKDVEERDNDNEDEEEELEEKETRNGEEQEINNRDNEEELEEKETNDNDDNNYEEQNITELINCLNNNYQQLELFWNTTKPELFQDVSFMNQEFNTNITNINNFYNNFTVENETCFNKTKLKDQKNCYVNLTNELNNTLILVNNTNRTYYDQKNDINTKILNLTNKVEKVINLDLSFVNEKLNTTINNIRKQYENNCNKTKLQDQKDCFDDLVGQLERNKIIDNYNQQKDDFNKKIKELKTKCDDYQKLNGNSFSLKVQYVLIKPINLEIAKIKKETNCENKKLLGLQSSCYQGQIDQIESFFSVSVDTANNFESHLKRINKKNELYELIYDDKISLSDKIRQIKAKIKEKIANNYYKVFVELQQKNDNVFYHLNSDYPELVAKFETINNKLSNNLINDLLNSIAIIADFDNIQKKLKVFVENYLQDKKLNSYIKGKLNSAFNAAFNLLDGYLIPIGTNVMALYYQCYIYPIAFIASSIGMYYWPTTENNSLAITDYYDVKSYILFVKNSYINAYSGFASINLAQELNINITALDSMNDKDLSSIISQVKQKENNLIENVNKDLKYKKIKQTFGVVLHTITAYVPQLFVLLFNKLTRKNINPKTNNQAGYNQVAYKQTHRRKNKNKNKNQNQ